MMASRVDLSLNGGSASILPALREGKSSLVAPTQLSATVTPRQKASQWAYELRLR